MTLLACYLYFKKFVIVYRRNEMALKLEKWIGKTNIANEFTDDQLKQLGSQVVDDWRDDLVTRSDWEKRTQDGLDLAMQLIEGKTWPWDGAANVKYPLIAYAAIQFHARAYPEVIRDNSVVKAKVIGKDPEGRKQERADRVSKHMSYQVLEEMTEWEEDTDRLLMMLPIIGTLFKKTYFCPVRRRNVSCLRKPLDIVVHNDAKSLEDSRRITDQGIWLHRNDIFERKAEGIFIDKDISYEFDEGQQKPEQFLEQHLWYDLDDDGYQEPYIVTVHRHSSTVVRVYPCYDKDAVIVTDSGKLARIEATQYFTKFSFLPSFDGSFYDVGFGQLLMPINEAINTNLNQLLDAGTLANVQGGLISRGIKVKGGKYQFQPGEWKQTDASPQDLKDGFFPLPTREPSAVLFNLLSFLVETGKMLSSVADVMSGEQAGPNEPVGTMMARIEQGMKVFNGIYKRIYRSLKSEFKKLAKLNRDHMDDEYYFRVLDIEQVAMREDYNEKDLDIVPVADPGQGTDIQRLAKAQALMQVEGKPGIDNWQVIRNYLKAIKVDNIEDIQPEEGKEASKQTPPDPKILEMELKKEQFQQTAAIQADKQFHENQLTDMKTESERALALLRIAQAEAAELGPQLEYYKQQLSMMSQENERLKQPITPQEGLNGSSIDQSGISGMEEPINNGAGIQVSQGLPENMGGEIATQGFGGADIQGGINQGGGIAGA
jgi:chaperonin GroES